MEGQGGSPYLCTVRSGMRSIAFWELKIMIGEGLPYLHLEGLENFNSRKGLEGVRDPSVRRTEF